jgi:hypothetical protein
MATKQRRLVRATITLRADQEAYIADMIGSPGDRSRWIREAIDIRMHYERRKRLGPVEDFMKDMENACIDSQKGPSDG